MNNTTNSTATNEKEFSKHRLLDILAALTTKIRSKIATPINISKTLCIVFTIVFMTVLLILPIIVLLIEGFSNGFGFFLETVTSEYTLYAMGLSLAVISAAVLASTIFGVAAAWCMSYATFRGKSILQSIIELPISISPIIIGLCFVILYGKFGYVGQHLEKAGIVVIFSWPGILLTNMCITTPYVFRSILPTMRDTLSRQEEVGHMLGANALQILYRITLPRIKWALLYGVILAVARSSGEFGAASVVSGFIRKKTVTLPLLVEIYYSEYLSSSAFACAILFVLLSVFTLICKYIAYKNSKFV